METDTQGATPSTEKKKGRKREVRIDAPGLKVRLQVPKFARRVLKNFGIK